MYGVFREIYNHHQSSGWQQKLFKLFVGSLVKHGWQLHVCDKDEGVGMYLNYLV